MTAIEYTWMEDDRSQHLLQQALRHHHHLWSYSALGSTGSLQEGKRESVLRTRTQVSFREQIPALFSESRLTGSAHTAQRCWSHESNARILKIRGLSRWLLRSCVVVNVQPHSALGEHYAHDAHDAHYALLPSQKTWGCLLLYCCAIAAIQWRKMSSLVRIELYFSYRLNLHYYSSVWDNHAK